MTPGNDERKIKTNYYANVRVGDVKTDYAYQRSLNPAWLRKIVKEYNPSLIRPLTLSLRENGELYVIDGNHTKEAIIFVKGEDAIAYAHIYTGLTVEEEAAFFNKMNSNSKKVTNNEKLKALVLSGDEASIHYIDLLNQSGIEWSYKGGGGRKVYDSHKIGITLLKLYGDDVFVQSLKVIKWTQNDELYNGKALGAVCYILEQIPGIDTCRLTSTLKIATMPDIIRRTHYYGIDSHQTIRAVNRLYALAVLDFYNKGLHKKNRVALQAI